MNRRKVRNIFAWLLSIIVSLAFLAAGIPKLLGRPAWIRLFSNWGYPKWFLLVIGALEVLGAILLFIPRFTAYAVAILTVVMLGAAYTHVANGEGLAIIRPLIFLFLLAIVTWLRRSSRKQLGTIASTSAPTSEV